jgi:integrase
MARKTLTDKGVAALSPRDKLYAHPDPQCPGHYVRVAPSGNKTFVAVARDPSGKQVWTTIGNAAHFDIEAARKKAREIIVSVKGGKGNAGPDTFESVAREWVKRHCEAKGLISTKKFRHYLELHIFPSWGGRDFTSIKRSDVASLLDKIEDNSGPVAADKVLTILSSICNWYATRHDDYIPPIVRGMRRSSTKERARDRVLSDHEIRLIWNNAEGTFGDLVRMLLLTGQRRDKVAKMKWDDVSVDGVWTIANGNMREKGTAGVLVLPQMARDILDARPHMGDNPYVFYGVSWQNGAYRGFHHGRADLEKKIGKLPRWTLHDLRRTARTLMERAGVSTVVGERVLGHALGGVLGTYNCHDYRDEKAHALRALAGLIASILRNDDANQKVRRLRG